MQWQDSTPETPLTELTVGDLFDAIGWALSHYRAGDQGIASKEVPGFKFEGHKPVMGLHRSRDEIGVAGWKEIGGWGEWRSNWWGLTTIEA